MTKPFLLSRQYTFCLLPSNSVLALMAQHCGIGRSAFSGYCQQLTNSSPIDYLNRCRLHHAANKFLEDKNISITALAFDLGFSSSQYFSRCFKKQFGLPPNQWRQQTASQNQ